jgi:two-component system cell cycle response regulator DivK
MNPTEAKVFIIEDNADNLYVVQRLLRNELHVRYLNARASGSLFFRWLEESDHAKLNLTQSQLDLILLDLQLPRENGYGILQQIRQHPQLQQTRVIAVTANVMPVDVQRTQDAGFDGFIGKPIDKNRFPAQIQRILDGESVWEPF